MAFTLKDLAGLMGMDADATETDVVSGLTRKLDSVVATAERVTALEADLAAARAAADVVPGLQAQADRVPELEAKLASMEMPPEQEPKYKEGDKVMYRDAERSVSRYIGMEPCYEMDNGECAPESMMEAISADMSARAADYGTALTAYAKLAGAPADDVPGLALQVARGAMSLTDAQAKLQPAPAPTVDPKVLEGMKGQDTRSQTPPTGMTLRGGQLIN